MKTELKSKARDRQAKANPIDFWSPPSLIATVFGVGKLPTAPGTWGSAVALPLGWAINYYFGAQGLPIAIVALFFLGWWASSAYMKVTGE